MFPTLIQYSDWGLFLLRLAIGIVFIYHALPKIKTPKPMAAGMGINPNAVLALGLVEAISGLALIVGLWTQWAALLLAIIMVGAWYMKMNTWHVPFTAHDKMGWEFDMVLLAGNLAIVLGGGGTIGVL